MECHKDFERGSDVSGFFYGGSLNYPPGNQQISRDVRFALYSDDSYTPGG